MHAENGTLSSRRRWSAVGVLALGGFAIGLAEFVAMGLLPNIARDLLPGVYRASSSRAVAQAGWVITSYGLGVVVGAPVIAASTARLPRKTLVVGLLALFTLGTVASAAASDFGLLLVARFVAALPHGAYFGAAGRIAARLIDSAGPADRAGPAGPSGSGSQGKGFAAVLAGLTAANVVGVPLITKLGQAAGWRAACLAIAGVYAVTLLAVLLVVPFVPAPVGGSPRDELAAFRKPQVWLVAAIASIGFSGFFAVDSYIAPITTNLTRLGAGAVPWALAVVGLGMTVGNALGGWASDRDLRRSLLIGFPALIVSTAVFALGARTPVGLFVGAFLVGGCSLFLAPALQSRLIAAAPGAQLMGAAVNQSATNIANSLGAAVGGLVIARGLGWTAPAWAGTVLVTAGFALALASFYRSSGDPVSYSDSE